MVCEDVDVESEEDGEQLVDFFLYPNEETPKTLVKKLRDLADEIESLHSVECTLYFSHAE